MCAPPEGADVFHEAENLAVGAPAPGFDLLRWDRGRVGRIRQARDEEPDVAAALPEALVRGQECTYPLRLDEATDEREGDGLCGFGQRHHRIRVDAGAGNHRDARSVHPQTLDHSAV